MCICRVVKCFAFSVTGFGQICARWRAVVVTYNKSTDCANMSKAVRLKCSTGVGYGYRYRHGRNSRVVAMNIKAAVKLTAAPGNAIANSPYSFLFLFILYMLKYMCLTEGYIFTYAFSYSSR